MPKLIVTSRYLQGGAKRSNYVEYIATREGAVAVREMETPEQSRENYVSYLANRPQSHGLFDSEDKPIDLRATVKEIAQHGGNVWSHVVSLRRDHAQQMGYDNLNAWRALVRRQLPNIAKAQKIDMKNLKWYAAFHDKESNPHVHIVVYSSDTREGFLTNQGIEQIRSGFANDIYRGELHHLYARQTQVRDTLKQESAALMKALADSIRYGNMNVDEELQKMTAELRGQLAYAKGKRVYGYLPRDTKQTVDRIFFRLAQNEKIQKMYALWCEMEQQKHDMYSSAKITPPPLIDNPQFKSVKNMIVRAVLEMKPLDMVDEQTITVEENPSEHCSDAYAPEDFVRNGENAVVIKVLNDTDAESETVSAYLPDEYCREDFVWNDENAVTIEIPTASSDYEIEIVDEPEEAEQVALDNTIFGLFVSLSRIICDDYDRGHRKLLKKADSKLLRVIQRQKEELGVRSDGQGQTL